MVFKPFTHLARQSFTKAFTHGYAQSVVAASQTYASSTTLNQFALQPAKFSRTQLQNAFSNASSSSGAGAKASQGSGGNGDFGLAAYYAAWQHAQQTGDDTDWRQFQFKRRIGWKPSEEVEDARDEHIPSPELPHPTKAAVNENVSAQVEEAVAREIQIQEEQAQAEESSKVTEVAAESAAGSAIEDVVISEAMSEESKIASDRIVQLATDESYSEIPAAFEYILREGLTPTVEAYNALLVAAIRLHPEAAQAIPKALDVYSDMLRRRVIPDEDTYQTLVQLLVTQAHDTIQAKQVLEQERVRYGGMEEPGKFMLQSSELERDILTEDHSLSIAMKLFDTATTRHSRLVFPLDLYRQLIIACAREGKVEDMIRIYSHMEMQKVTPHATIFPFMIDAFAGTGDLSSAVECYNEYRSLAVSDDNGVFSIVKRLDGQVYAAVIRAYLSCGKEEGAMHFLDRIRSSFDEVTENREGRWAAVEAVIVQDALVQHSLNAGEHAKALDQAKDQLHDAARDQAISRICVAAADAGDLTTASEAYDRLSPSPDTRQPPAISLLALHVRRGNVSAARSLWIMLNTVGQATPDMVQPTAMYTVALLKSGQVEEGLGGARNMFARIRNASVKQGAVVPATVREQVTESLHLFGRVLMQTAAVLSPQASMTLLWSMVENGGLVSPLAEHAVANLGPMGISQLKPADLTLALQVQAGMLANNSAMLFDVAHPIRFAHMLDVALSTALPLDAYTTGLVDQAVAKLFTSHPDVVKRWQDHLERSSETSFLSDRRSPVSRADTNITTPSVSPDSFDPHAHATDFRGSAIIADELEKTAGRAETHLNEALIRLKNMRRIGRHPRYITYAKLITAAAKFGRMELVRDIHAMARADVPLDPAYNAVKYGWVSIIDAMIAACLTLGDRHQAGQYHQELLDLGSAPSANTFGLYITTLKESTKTFDEATEALKIFHRAVAEGVEPTSFLYNALIGKLGKARRIDDCLAYFAEMRANNVRPTSVTYGTIVNALCRVSDERFAEEMFEEMESMPNYKPRPAPYNSMIQYFLNTKRDRSKVLAYYERMQARNIKPTMHTYKLLIDAHASLDPVDMPAAERVIAEMQAAGSQPDAVHYASLIHAQGCVQHDLPAARKVFDAVLADRRVRLQPCLYQALFEGMVATNHVADTEDIVRGMKQRHVEMTAYIANTLIHGWAAEGNVAKAKTIYDSIGIDKREPSTYEAMTRAFLGADERAAAAGIVQEMMSRGYPSAVANKIIDLVGSVPSI
ncbi:uncharacterized protein N7482_007237 [Penicillium canariense]|uniref:Tetratricopeptide repeat domain-containing protein n=1 Tax=Penicillium canariense TaxID=189055 RepID=A0A9W9LK44_9EURO|nr:uncharacterized protein N7482_007237 [Penicillium canariense]KAJ5160233.1 hypothetical protein N7482_007237 [Penicillium canariense]